jgi:hypothetical protein
VLFGFAYVGLLVPRSAVEQPTTGLRCAPAPLLVEVGNAFLNASVPHITDPGRITSSVSRSAPAGGDDPMEAIKVQLVHWTEQRFRTDEANDSWDLAQVVRALGGLGPVKETERNVREGPDSRGNTRHSREGWICPFRPLLSLSLPHFPHHRKEFALSDYGVNARYPLPRLPHLTLEGLCENVS